MRRSSVSIGAVVVLCAALLPNPAAANLLQHNVEQTTCWHPEIFDNLVLCIGITLRFHLDCHLGPVADIDENVVVPEGFARCTSISEWYWLGMSIGKLPGEGEGTFGHEFEVTGPDGQTTTRAFDGTFPHCAWEADTLGCNDTELFHEATGVVPLAPGECLAVSLSMYVTAEAWAPVQDSPIALSDAASDVFGHQVCAPA